MPIYATTDAKNFWEQSLKPTTRARSLAAAKFVTIAENNNDKTWRKASCEAIAKGATLAAKSDSLAQFATTLLAEGAAILHAKLEARLIIDAGNGVIENGGICLDRTSGIPFIPGSAVKGCARRYAIQQLSEESEHRAKAKLLAQIAIIFGYGDQEWKAGRQNKSARSDFWLAMVPLCDAGPELDEKRHKLWTTVSEEAAKLIFEYLGRSPKEPEKPLASQLPNMSGSVAFLPAYPEKDPGIEIDVLTPHHPKYYSGDKLTATDDEDPNPILFPTIAPNTTFRFPLIPLNQGAWTPYPQVFAASTPLEFARTHLSEALQLFGLGAKTNAGYGWFSIDKTAEKKIAQLVQDQKDADALKELKPCPEIRLALQARLDKNQLAGDLNAYSFDPPLWPKDSTILYQLTLFHFIRENAPNLATSKKGEKAMTQLARKLSITLP